MMVAARGAPRSLSRQSRRQLSNFVNNPHQQREQFAHHRNEIRHRRRCLALVAKLRHFMGQEKRIDAKQPNKATHLSHQL
jgi:hypothetical protein